jgi:tetratricopeptide (TPR) repeat protein
MGFHPIMRLLIRAILYGLSILALLVVPLGCSKKSPQQDTLKEYRKMLERQKTASAREEQEALKKIPEMTAEGYEKLGDSHLRQGNLDMALIQYGKALRLEPGRAGLRYKMGRLFIEKGLVEEAKKEFQEILRTDSNHALSHEGMGRAYVKSGEWIEAEKSFLRATQIDAGLWQAHNFLGIIYDRQKQFEAAITRYKNAISINPNDGGLFNNLGMSLYLMGDYEKAIKAFSEGIIIDASNGMIYNNLALAFYKLGKYHETFEAFRKGSDEATAHYNLGCLHMIDERYEEAMKAFEKAIELKPGFYVKAHENLKKARAASNTKQ